MSVPNGDKPAFPPHTGSEYASTAARGLSKREHFAAMAMQGLLSDGEGYVKFAADRDLASAAVGIADALIEALGGES